MALLRAKVVLLIRDTSKLASQVQYLGLSDGDGTQMRCKIRLFLFHSLRQRQVLVYRERRVSGEAILRAADGLLCSCLSEAKAEAVLSLSASVSLVLSST